MPIFGSNVCKSVGTKKWLYLEPDGPHGDFNGTSPDPYAQFWWFPTLKTVQMHANQ